ncbi:MAG: hypothetical protein ACXWDB_06695, partial [Aeromicrobium sp.]
IPPRQPPRQTGPSATSSDPHLTGSVFDFDRIRGTTPILLIGWGLSGLPGFGGFSVMVTHDREFVPLTDSVATMRDGRLTAPVLTSV